MKCIYIKTHFQSAARCRGRRAAKCGTTKAEYIDDTENLRVRYVEECQASAPKGAISERGCPNLPTPHHQSFANAVNLETLSIHSVDLQHSLILGGPEVDVPGLVRVHYICRGTFETRFKLQKFPYDTQELPIQLRNVFGGVDNRQYLLAPHPDCTSFKFKDLALDEYDVYTPPVVSLLLEKTPPVLCDVLPSAEKGEKHRLVFTIVLLRRPAYYHNQIVVPLHLIVTLAVLTLLENSHSNMVSITLTLILTAVAFRYTINDKLPPCAYQTVLDKDLNACLCCLFAFVIENAVATQHHVSRWVSGGVVVGMCACSSRPHGQHCAQSA